MENDYSRNNLCLNEYSQLFILNVNYKFMKHRESEKMALKDFSFLFGTLLWTNICLFIRFEW